MSVQDSLLLNLPGELRNMVYSFVLTSSGPVTCRPYEKDDQLHQRILVQDGEVKKKLNTMKFFCRQLYQGTSILLPGSSELVFPMIEGSKDSASVMCARSLTTAPAMTWCGVEKIDVHERHPTQPMNPSQNGHRLFGLYGIRDLAIISCKHAHVPITVHLPQLFSNFKVNMVLQLAIRKIFLPCEAWLMDQFVEKCYRQAQESVRYMEQVWEGHGENAAPFPANLMLKPRESESDDAISFGFFLTLGVGNLGLRRYTEMVFKLQS